MNWGVRLSIFPVTGTSGRVRPLRVHISLFPGTSFRPHVLTIGRDCVINVLWSRPNRFYPSSNHQSLPLCAQNTGFDTLSVGHSVVDEVGEGGVRGEGPLYHLRALTFPSDTLKLSYRISPDPVVHSLLNLKFVFLFKTIYLPGGLHPK